MFFTCPACQQKSIFLTTKLLHVAGSTHHSRANRFECTHCHALLGCAFSPLPFFLVGALLQLFLTQAGALADLWMGGVLCAGVALWLMPIRVRSEEEQSALFGAVRRFDDPLDQGLFYVESRLLGVVAGVLVAGLMFSVLAGLYPAAQAHAGGLILLFPVGLAALVAGMGYSALIYRLGRRSWQLRGLADGLIVIASVLLWRW